MRLLPVLSHYLIYYIYIMTSFHIFNSKSIKKHTKKLIKNHWWIVFRTLRKKHEKNTHNDTHFSINFLCQQKVKITKNKSKWVKILSWCVSLTCYFVKMHFYPWLHYVKCHFKVNVLSMARLLNCSTVLFQVFKVHVINKSICS